MLRVFQLMPNLEYVVNLKGSNTLGNIRNLTSSLKLSPTAASTVTVISVPTSATLLAEVTVAFCKEVTSPLRYIWSLNNTPIKKDGSLLMVPDLPPGVYNISCLVLLINSSEAIGMVILFVTKTNFSTLGFFP